MDAHGAIEAQQGGTARTLSSVEAGHKTSDRPFF